MAEKNLITQALIVKNLAHSGYRRAGLVLQKGDNPVEPETLTHTQLAQIKQDARLHVCEVETDQGHADSGAVDSGSLSDSVDVNKPKSLVEAIKLLDPSNKAHFTSGGKPQTDVLAELMGDKVSAKERDEAWEEVQSEQQNSEGS
ncbi:HI1506-related protein [Vibrio mediterranei]|uniref:HI1506-related protein n=1 Tax=Vibrio mediterranei TaxID=689 RepID=UPI001EFC7510|nr:HI1506-related protein [Vibrio mediterranei]MCG9624637.1 HI1506-related protein [Vibrio mediterranei]